MTFHENPVINSGRRVRRSAYLIYYLCLIKSVAFYAYLPAIDPARSPAAKKSPASASQEKSKCVKSAIVVLGVHGDFLVKQHANQVKRGNEPVPQTSEEPVCVSRKAMIYRFTACTAGEYDK